VLVISDKIIMSYQRNWKKTSSILVKRLHNPEQLPKMSCVLVRELNQIS